jgi:MHS family proline/betaine transporter-like MFS transporter
MFQAKCLCHLLEFRFDFAVFGAFADIIGEEFFPSTNENLQLLKSLSVFGAAFAMRPFGKPFFGEYDLKCRTDF